MVRLADLPPREREFLAQYSCPDVADGGFVPGPPLAERRVAVVTTAGLRKASDPGFSMSTPDYRVLRSAQRDELMMDHVSAGHDRTGFLQDLNTVLPIDRLLELAADGKIGSVSDLHYSFMGAASIPDMAGPARALADVLERDGVDAVLLSPV